MTGAFALLLALRGGALPAAPASHVAAAPLDTAVFAGGCFWGVEAVYEHVKGVVTVTSGYAGGTAASPSYEDVSGGDTGYAESVQIIYDPGTISFGTLMRIFVSVAHDPTQLNRQGPDVGTQYRSAIFYMNARQKSEAEAYVAQLNRSGFFHRPVVTQVAPLTAFHVAEDYHQDFAEKHPLYPYIVINDRPKVDALRRNFPNLYRDPAVTATR